MFISLEQCWNLSYCSKYSTSENPISVIRIYSLLSQNWRTRSLIKEFISCIHLTLEQISLRVVCKGTQHKSFLCFLSQCMQFSKTYVNNVLSSYPDVSLGSGTVHCKLAYTHRCSTKSLDMFFLMSRFHFPFVLKISILEIVKRRIKLKDQG